MLKPPIFVIGNPRSGTTLLRLMLTCHPHIVIPPEAGFAIWLYPKYRHWSSESLVEPFLDDLVNTRKFETWGMNYADLQQRLRSDTPQTYSELISAIYNSYAEAKGKGGARWGDKNNYYLEHIGALREIFPEALLVHIVRDPRNVACSYQQLNRSEITSPYTPKLPDQAGDIARTWKGNIQTIRRSFDQCGWENVHELRYEDLLSAPEVALRDLCDFLEEPYNAAMLDYHQLNRAQRLEPEEFLQWKQLTLQPPQRDRVDRFRRDLSNQEVREIEQITRDELNQYGYDRAW